jgi:NADH dehydrogenase
VSEPERLQGAAQGVDVILHVAGIVAEDPPESTFQSVNVDGTKNMIREAERARVGRFIYVSSLGADRGESDYHRSKRSAEALVQNFHGGWIILRPGNVYGPGDDVVSLLLKMVRTLPAVPVVGGDREFQPVWADDLGAALGVACERADLAGRVLEVAGPERTSTNDLLDRMERLTGRSPVRIPVPQRLAGAGVRVAELLGIDTPVNDSQLTMLAEGNVIDDPTGGGNALARELGVTPTPLDAGLRALLDALPEQLPTEGVGALERKRYWANVAEPTAPAEALFRRFLANFQEVTPDHVNLAAEPGAPTRVIECGQTVTMALPMRGNVQVRVAELTPTSMTLQTVAGHPLAGAVRFVATPHGADRLLFEVELFDRAANAFDWVAMTAVGTRLQDQTWVELVERFVAESGGRALDGVRRQTEKLDGAEAERVERWLEELALARKRADNEAALGA